MTDAGKGERSGTGKAPFGSLHGTQIETAVANLHPREERERRRGREGKRERGKEGERERARWKRRVSVS